jgi:hypothetical protein
MLAVSLLTVVLWTRSVISERAQRSRRLASALATAEGTPPVSEPERPAPQIYRPPPGKVPPLKTPASPGASAAAASGTVENYGMPEFVPPAAEAEGSAET